MIDEVLYKFNDDPNYYECCQVDISVASFNEDDNGVPDADGGNFNSEDLAEEMAKEIYTQSCGDQPFPIKLHIYTMDKKHLGSYEVHLEMEPTFFSKKIEEKE